MKSFLLLCLIGVAVSFPGQSGSGGGYNGLKWRQGQEYVFDYSGRLLTGLPELATQYAGVGIKAKVHVQVIDSQQSGPLKFALKLSQVKYVRVNDKLQPEDRPETRGQGEGVAENWRNLPLGQYEDLPSDQAQYVQRPTQVSMQPNGEFEHMVVAEDEPEWSINLKKALIAIFQTKFSGSSVNTEANGQFSNSLSGGNGNDNGGQDDSEQVISWTGSEMSLDGTCQVVYQLHELPSYMIKDSNNEGESENWRRNCPSGSRFFELVKTRDVSSCSKHTIFSFYKPGFFKCGSGNCEGMWSRSSITRYYGCGQSRQDIQIQTVVNEGELVQKLLGYKTEKFLTGSKQILKLVETRNSGPTPNPNGGGTQVLRTLYFEYGSLPTGRGGSGSGGQPGYETEWTEEEGRKIPLPRHLFTAGNGKFGGNNGGRGGGNSGENKGQIMQQIKQILKSVVDQDLTDLVTLPQKQISMKILTVSRGMAFLNSNDINSVYNELKSQYSGDQNKQHTLKNLFFDVASVTGTRAGIQFLKEKISSGEVSTTQALSFFMFLPTYVLAPSQQTLNILYELITQESRIKNSPILNHQAILSFTVLVQRACISDNRQTSYPTYVWGEFCRPDSRIVVEKWLPYLQSIVTNQQTSPELRNVVIVALGHMSHKNVIPILLPFVESGSPSGGGRPGQGGRGGSGSNRLARLLAVYSLGQPGRKNPQLVNDVLIAVFTNPAENTEIRISALNILLKNNPQMAIIQTIGSSTWYEKDQEVLKAVNSAFSTLSHQYDVNPMAETYTSLAKKVYLVYPMIKKTGGRFPTSSLLFGAEQLPQLGVGYEYLTSWTSSRESVMPSGLYSKLVYFLDRYQFNPMEIGLRMRNGQNLINQLSEILTNGQLRSGSEHEFSEKIKESLHREWREVVNKLRIKNRGGNDQNEGRAETTFYMNVFEDSPVFASLQSETTEQLRQKIGQLMGGGGDAASIKSKICGRSQVNAQRVHDMAPNEYTIPSDMGLPIMVELHMPVVASIRGDVNVDCSRSLPDVKLNVHTVYASQYTGWVGTLCPFTKEMVATGIDEHAVLNLPVEFGINIDLQQRKLNVQMKPMQQVNSVSRPVDILHFHVRPYTVQQRYFDLTPQTLAQGVKFINSRHTPVQSKTWSFGEMFGLSLRSTITSETRFMDFRAVVEKLRMYNWNPLNVLRFGWASSAISETGEPSLRKHEMQIKYDPSQSTTKEIEFGLSFDVITKTQGETNPIKFHKLSSWFEGRRGGHGRHGGHHGGHHGPNMPFKWESMPVSEVGEEKVQKLKQLLENTGIENGAGVGIKATWTLRGSRPRTYSQWIKLVAGDEGSFRSKWNGHFESQGSGNKICINGQVTSPVLPSWKIEELRGSNVQFNYQNEIGFGHQCTESKITVEGSAKTSQSQKEWSRTSPDAKKLEKMMAKNEPLVKSSKVAEKVRMQATTLDEVDFKIDYHNVPRGVMIGSNYAVEALKSMWWPYVVQPGGGSHQGGRGGAGPTTTTNFWTFKFQSQTPTFTLRINRPSQEGVIEFQHVRIPYPLDQVIPMNGHNSPAKVGSLALTGNPLYPTCNLERNNGQDYVNTYDNRTSRVSIDDCYHVLSSDCSPNKEFLVLVKSQTSSKSGPIELKTFIANKTEIIFRPSGSHSRYQTSIEVYVNGTKINFQSGSGNQRQHNVVDQNGQRLGVIVQDNQATQLRSQWVDVKYDTRRVQVNPSNYHKNRLCGLCGDNNGQKMADLRGPNKCVFSKPEYVSAAYRVPLGSKTCSPLASHIEEGLRREQGECAAYDEIPTQVIGSYKVKTGPCTRHQHEIIERPSELCFSRRPVIDCSPRCKPSGSGSVVPKNVSFACMIKNRTAYHYAEKVRQGQTVPELSNLPESFSISLPLPSSCVPVNPLV